VLAALGGTAEQAAEKLVEGIKSAPQALKRRHVFNGLTARVELMPFAFVEKAEFFGKP
jgi:hypothetical protein